MWFNSGEHPLNTKFMMMCPHIRNLRFQFVPWTVLPSEMSEVGENYSSLGQAGGWLRKENQLEETSFSKRHVWKLILLKLPVSTVESLSVSPEGHMAQSEDTDLCHRGHKNNVHGLDVCVVNFGSLLGTQTQHSRYSQDRPAPSAHRPPCQVALLCGTARLTRDQSLCLLWGNLALRELVEWIFTLLPSM